MKDGLVNCCINAWIDAQIGSWVIEWMKNAINMNSLNE